MSKTQRQNTLFHGTRNFRAKVSRLIRSPFDILGLQRRSVSGEGRDDYSVEITEEESASNILPTHDESESEVDIEDDAVNEYPISIFESINPGASVPSPALVINSSTQISIGQVTQLAVSNGNVIPAATIDSAFGPQTATPPLNISFTRSIQTDFGTSTRSGPIIIRFTPDDPSECQSISIRLNIDGTVDSRCADPIAGSSMLRMITDEHTDLAELDPIVISSGSGQTNRTDLGSKTVSSVNSLDDARTSGSAEAASSTSDASVAEPVLTSVSSFGDSSALAVASSDPLSSGSTTMTTSSSSSSSSGNNRRRISLRDIAHLPAFYGEDDKVRMEWKSEYGLYTSQIALPYFEPTHRVWVHSYPETNASSFSSSSPSSSSSSSSSSCSHSGSGRAWKRKRSSDNDEEDEEDRVRARFRSKSTSPSYSSAKPFTGARTSIGNEKPTGTRLSTIKRSFLSGPEREGTPTMAPLEPEVEETGSLSTFAQGQHPQDPSPSSSSLTSRITTTTLKTTTSPSYLPSPSSSNSSRKRSRKEEQDESGSVSRTESQSQSEEDSGREKKRARASKKKDAVEGIPSSIPAPAETRRRSLRIQTQRGS